MSVTRCLAVLSMLFSIAVSGCDAETEAANTLRGSVKRIYPLDFDTVRARLSDSELAIQYVVEGGEVPVQLYIDLESNPLAAGTTIELPGGGGIIGARNRTTLPTVVSATIQLDAFSAETGGRISGTFDAVLKAQQSQFTLVGTFDAEVEDVRQEPR